MVAVGSAGCDWQGRQPTKADDDNAIVLKYKVSWAKGRYVHKSVLLILGGGCVGYMDCNVGLCVAGLVRQRTEHLTNQLWLGSSSAT